MNEHDVRELLKLVRGIEHFLERCLKTITEKQLKQQGIEITEAPRRNIFADDLDAKATEGFEF